MYDESEHVANNSVKTPVLLISIWSLMTLVPIYYLKWFPFKLKPYVSFVILSVLSIRSIPLSAFKQ